MSQFVKALLAKMSLEEKVAQLSCINPFLIMKGEEVQGDKMDAHMKLGLGRITQFATPFYSSPRSVARAYNKVQKYLVEQTRLGIPALIQIEVTGGVLMTGAACVPAPISIASTWNPGYAEEIGET